MVFYGTVSFSINLNINHILCLYVEKGCCVHKPLVPFVASCSTKIELSIFQSFDVIEQSHDHPNSHATGHSLESSYVSVVLMSGIWNVTLQDINHTHQPNNCKCSVPWCMVLCEILLLSVFTCLSKIQGKLKQNLK